MILNANTSFALQIYIMKKFILLLFIAFSFLSCSKDSAITPAVTATVVRYELECKPINGSAITSAISYYNNTGTLTTGQKLDANNLWSYSNTNWAPKTGETLGFSALINGNASCRALIYVNDKLVDYSVISQSTTPVSSFTIDVKWTAP
jgi:hypothetical protein